LNILFHKKSNQQKLILFRDASRVKNHGTCLHSLPRFICQGIYPHMGDSG